MKKANTKPSNVELITTLFENRIIESKDLSTALKLSLFYSKFIRANNFAVKSSLSIENYLVDYTINNLPWNDKDTKKKDNVLHVITQPYLVGGHTRLMENLVSMDKNASDLFICNSNVSGKIIERLNKYFANLVNANEKDNIKKLQEMVARLSCYSKVVLHTHPGDILSIIAIGVAKRLYGIQVFFVNHADHIFSFGDSIADVRLLVSRYGLLRDKDRSIKSKSSFIGIPIASKITPLKKLVSNKNLSFFSAGDRLKYKPFKGCSIIDYVKNILLNYPTSHFTVIGPNIKSDYWWWLIKLRFGSRLTISPVLPYEQYMNLLEEASVYVDSHPMPGGTAFVEQFYRGKPCIGLISPFQGYTPLEKVKSQNVSITGNLNINENTLNDLYKSIDEVHGWESVKNRYITTLYQDITHDVPTALVCNERTDINYSDNDKIRKIDLYQLKYFLSTKDSFVVLIKTIKLSAVCSHLFKKFLALKI